MNTSSKHDITIIGGGPAGVTAALRAAELGASVAIVERDRFGGTCTNDGCVPTRALAKAARLVRDAGQFAEYGLVGAAPTVDFQKLISRTQRIIYQIEEKKQLIKHLEESSISVYIQTGAASFVDPHTIVTESGIQLVSDKIILCVGGHPRRLPFPGGEHALTHSDVWTMKVLPDSVAIVGAAATGCQLASIFSDFGTKVTLLDIARHILPGEDSHVAKEVRRSFEQQDIQIITGIEGIERIEKPLKNQGATAKSQPQILHFNQAGETKSITADAVILAVGWPGNVEGLNLPAARVETERGFIYVDENLRTSAPHIFAAGDITGRMMLVQSAGYEARIAAENALLETSKTYQHRIVPHGGFTDPEYGSVGLTESNARKTGDIAVSIIPYADLDHAVIDGHTEGFCKLVVSKDTHKVLGAHVVGEQAVEIVQLVSAGMASEIRVDQLAGLELAYPTYTAIVGLAARKLTRDLGILPVAPEWRALKLPYASEWERTD